MRYFIFYLVIQHYFSIFAAEFATLITVLCRTKYVGHQDRRVSFPPVDYVLELIPLSS